jgi:acetyl esterase/lipase
MLGDKANPAVVLHKVRHWLPRGWIVVSLNYRLLPEADPLQQADDVARALAAVQREAQRWGGDGHRVALCGHSTGAHLAALVLADTSLAAAHGLQPPQAAVLLDSAALDVVQVMTGPHLPLHDRAFGNDPAFWRRASPWHHLQQALPPLLLVCAQDREAATQQAERFAERARSAGGSAEVAPVALSHREINEQLGQHEELTRRVDDFLRAQGLP